MNAENEIGQDAGLQPRQHVEREIAAAAAKECFLQLCIVTDGPVADLLATVNSIERATEIALSGKRILGAVLDIASMRGEWEPERDNEGILSRIYPHLISVRGHREECDNLAAALQRMVKPDTAKVFIFVQAGVIVSPNLLGSVVDVLKYTTAAIADTRRLPTELAQPYNLATGRITHANPFSVGFVASVWSKLGGFDVEYFPRYLFTIDFSWRARAAGFTCLLDPAATYFYDPIALSSEQNADLIEETVLLAHKWSQVHLRDHILAFAASRTDARLRAVPEKYRYRVDNGFLPAPLEHLSHFATFSGDCFPSGVWQQ